MGDSPKVITNLNIDGTEFKLQAEATVSEDLITALLPKIKGELQGSEEFINSIATKIADNEDILRELTYYVKQNLLADADFIASLKTQLEN